jgi:hypothetical protein
VDPYCFYCTGLRASFTMNKKVDKYYYLRPNSTKDHGLPSNIAKARKKILLLVTLATLGYFWLLLATFGYFWLLLAAFGYFWLLLATFGYFWLLLVTFGYFWLLFSQNWAKFTSIIWSHYHPAQRQT